MELTNEQIDAACEALQAMKKPEPKVLWIIVDRDGDTSLRARESETEARHFLAQKNADGKYAPYTLYRGEATP